MDVFGELLAPKYLRWLWDGFLVTIGLSLCVCVVSTVGGFLLCVARMEGRGPVGWAARAYLSVFRNTPLLVQLFFWYFGAASFLPEGFLPWLNTPRQIELPGLALRWPSFEFIAGFFGLTLFTTAFIAEEFRAGVQGVGAGQYSAAAAVGLTRWQAWRWIILPQALRNAFSPLVGQYMHAVKNSSLTMAIGLAELSYASRQVETQTFKTFQAFGIATLLYLLLIVLIELGAQAWQRRRRFRRLGAQGGAA
ncbi:amino acid ABC transporter permease [Corticibacter populi]|uniref:Amino acid ABC transporter permease n=2 Tax=Corticibacter populi TaxID=1550736 RepID=A0A3M6QV26_9BURK|nr:amino acid ABC transporter permease [Corticibacter populi]RMX06352.1 amino acid ABC transporter permease [Corticibacter populi]RZS32106.1 amino acid ABC transporter membrane protein 1 (PAAT family) [Corticibacter populi]